MTMHSVDADNIGPLQQELDVVIHSLSIAHGQLAADEQALVDGLLERAHALKELPEHELASLVEQAHALLNG